MSADRSGRDGWASLAVVGLLLLVGCSGGRTTSTAPTGSGGRITSGERSPATHPAALDFRAQTLSGVPFDAAERLAGGPAVLWFWAPWCTICRAEAPDVARVAAEFGGRVPFLGVPGRGSVPDMRDFVEATGTGGFEHVVDADGAIWTRFGVVAQPAFALVGGDGQVEVFTGALPVRALRTATERLASG